MEKKLVIEYFIEEAQWIGLSDEDAKKYAEEKYEEWKVKMDKVRAENLTASAS